MRARRTRALQAGRARCWITCLPVAVLLSAVVAACGHSSAPASSVSPTSSHQTFTSSQFGFAITYDAATLSTLERTSGNSLEGPARPGDWVGLYVPFFLAEVSAAKGGVLNVGLYAPANPPTMIFISASERDQTVPLAQEMRIVGAAIPTVILGQSPNPLSSPSPLPLVTVAGLRGYRVPVVRDNVDYVYYLLFGPRFQYVVCLAAGQKAWASVAPSLEAAVQTLRFR